MDPYKVQLESNPVKFLSGGHSVHGARHLIQLVLVVDRHQMTSMSDTGILKKDLLSQQPFDVTFEVNSWHINPSSPLHQRSSVSVWTPLYSGRDHTWPSLIYPPLDMLSVDSRIYIYPLLLLWHRKIKSCQCCILVACVDLSAVSSYRLRCTTWKSVPVWSPQHGAWFRSTCFLSQTRLNTLQDGM